MTDCTLSESEKFHLMSNKKIAKYEELIEGLRATETQHSRYTTPDSYYDEFARMEILRYEELIEHQKAAASQYQEEQSRKKIHFDRDYWKTRACTAEKESNTLIIDNKKLKEHIRDIIGEPEDYDRGSWYDRAVFLKITIGKIHNLVNNSGW